MAELKTDPQLLAALKRALTLPQSPEDIEAAAPVVYHGVLETYERDYSGKKYKRFLHSKKGERSPEVIIYELVNTESHPVYKALEVSNGNRQYDFLRSIVQASLDMGKPFLSQQLIKAFNFHSITCLHAYAGEYRPCPGRSVGQYVPPAHYRVPALMDDFINTVNRAWDQTTASNSHGDFYSMANK